MSISAWMVHGYAAGLLKGAMFFDAENVVKRDSNKEDTGIFS